MVKLLETYVCIVMTVSELAMMTVRTSKYIQHFWWWIYESIISRDDKRQRECKQKKTVDDDGPLLDSACGITLPVDKSYHHRSGITIQIKQMKNKSLLLHPYQ